MTSKIRILLTTAALAMTVFGPDAARASRSHRFLGMCRYYSALSDELGCPHDGYLARTAAPYCRKYDGLTERLSRQGVGALARIKLCLQRSLERTPALKCGNVLPVALKSHRVCYREAKFCSLGFFEQLEILKIGAPILSEPGFARVGNEILGDCFDPTEAPAVSMNGPVGRGRDGLQ